jgi:hypothetical protein
MLKRLKMEIPVVDFNYFLKSGSEIEKWRPSHEHYNRHFGKRCQIVFKGGSAQWMDGAAPSWRFGWPLHVVWRRRKAWLNSFNAPSAATRL